MTESRPLWFDAGRLNDIPVRGSRRIKHNEQRIALFRTIENKVYALRDSCPHDAGPLSEGIVHDSCVTCPLHNWVISLETGEAQGADSGKTQVYPVKLDGQKVLLKLAPVTC